MSVIENQMLKICVVIPCLQIISQMFTSKYINLRCGFTQESMENYLHWINVNNPEFIIWDKDFQEGEYAKVINQDTDERKIAFNFMEFNSQITKYYKFSDTITNNIIVYRPIK